MSLYDSIKQDILSNKARKESGLYNSIVTPFPRLSQVWPGFEQKRQYIICANSGIGKTQLTKFLVINSAIEFCIKHKMPLKILYFALEESKESFIATIICNQIYKQFGITVKVSELYSRGEFLVSQGILDMIDKVRPAVEQILEYVIINDEPQTPHSLFSRVRDYMKTIGKFYYNGDEVKLVNGESILYNEYKLNNPQTYVLVVIDHISLLMIEKGKTKHENIDHFSSYYCQQRMRDQFGITPILVQQLTAAKEQVDFNFKGGKIEEKLEPTLDSLADCKLTQRDADMVISLFSPHRYKIAQHINYDIDLLQNRYRHMRFLKDRHHGLESQGIGLYFNGAANYFEELPKAADMTREDYAKYSKQ